MHKVKLLLGEKARNRLQVPKFVVKCYFHYTLGNFPNIWRTVCKNKDISANVDFLFLFFFDTEEIRLTKEFKNAYLHFCASFFFWLKVYLLFMD